MTLKRLHTVTSGQRQVRVFRDTEWNEYRCRLYENLVLYSPADYHTDDALDAFDTAKQMVKEPGT